MYFETYFSPSYLFTYSLFSNYSNRKVYFTSKIFKSNANLNNNIYVNMFFDIESYESE